MKKKISVLMALVLMMSIIFGVNVSAAVSYPAISSSAYIEFKAQQNINVYKDTACKIRGTSSPLKAYNASVATGDVCYIYKITSSYIQINYPTASGRRIGYIKRADLFDKTVPEEYISSAKASVTVYKAEGSSSIAKGDKVWRVDPKMGYSGYRAVIYEAKSGKRAYKMGYITLADLEKIKTINSTMSSIKKSLADVAYSQLGTKGTNRNGSGSGDYQKYGKWYGNNGVQWCAQFVSWCVNQAGVSTSIVPKAQACTSMQKSNYYKKWNSSALKQINKNDVIFFCSDTGQESHHVGIVYSVSGSKITVIEGNSSSDTVKMNTYTISNSSNGQIKNGQGSWRYFCGYIPVN